MAVCTHAAAQDGKAADQGTYVLYLPEFLSSTPKHGADTTYSYEYYDARTRKVSLDTVTDFSAIYSVSMFKSYTDRAHTFVDKDGREKPLPVSKIVYRYDRSGANKWMTIDYATNKTGTLNEFKDEIVKTDSSVVNENNRIIKYYRVEPGR